MYTQK